MRGKRILTLLLAAVMLAMPTIPALAAEDAGIPEGASFEYIENISFGYEGYDYPEENAFYIYSPSNPHSFDLLSSFMNGLIFVYPDKPYASKEEALAALEDAGLIDIAESCPAYIIVAIPANGESWTEADVDMYDLYQYYAAGGYFDILSGIGAMNPMETEFKRLTMHSLQYVIAEGSGATFANNYLSQNAGRIAGLVTFGGSINADLKLGYAVPSYLVGADTAAVDYWKKANEVDFEPVAGTFVNSGYVQKKVTAAAGGSEFEKGGILTAWNEMLSRTTRLCITANLVLSSRVGGDWVLMSWPNYDELGLTRYSYVFEDGKVTPYDEYESRKNSVHTLIPESVIANPNKAVPLLIVLHGMSDDPLNVVNGCGWADKAAEEGFIVVSPDNEDPDYLVDVIEYTKTLYKIDTSRIYITGFSMGGMNTAISGFINTDIYAAMAPMGATGVAMTEDGRAGEYASRIADEDVYDIPACVIVGSIDDSNVKVVDGVSVIAGIDASGTEKIFEFNNMPLGKQDFAKTPLWGYTPNERYALSDKGSEWVFHDFYKDGYATPFIQLVTITGAGHANNDYMATVAWDFLSQYSRADDGSVVGETYEFNDIGYGDWYLDAAQYVGQNGLIQGTGGGKFSADIAFSRAMLATVLWRMEGSPEPTGGSPFTDVTQDWYTKAVVWANENGIVEGCGNGKFGPEDSLTREQVATTLYRYCAYTGADVSARADISAYNDAGSVSDWALEAVKWANAEGIITGKTAATLDPKGTASRAEAAVVLYRTFA